MEITTAQEATMRHTISQQEAAAIQQARTIHCLGGGNPHTLCPCPRCVNVRRDALEADFARMELKHKTA